MKQQRTTIINTNYVWLLIILIVLINSLGLFIPLMDQDDPTLYANIAKNIAISNDWINLIMHHKDWLDKPHFPFWVAAFSYKIFGINSFAYLLPGFLFNLLGGIYTYKLAKKLYSSDVAILSVVIYLSSLHLLISSINLRAEAYLLGEIMPACYYWYLYYEHKGLTFKNLILAGMFSGLAIMTKGVFLVLTIFSGLSGLWIYKKQWRNFISLKWLLALCITGIFILPELISLYLQFDMHPEKVIFGHTHVSGLRFFFFDSQFGRFFNNGPIKVQHKPWEHYLYFIHTFIWSFIPWIIIFILAIYQSFKKNDLEIQHKYASIYLYASFLPTFILFSVTSFQLDYYINILIPFAAIFTAKYLSGLLTTNNNHAKGFYTAQSILSYGLLVFVCILSYMLLPLVWAISLVLVVIFIILGVNYYILANKFIKMLWLSSLSSCMIFIFCFSFFYSVYRNYDVGYQLAIYMKSLPPADIVDFNIDSYTLNFYSHNNYVFVQNVNGLKDLKRPYYLFAKDTDLVNLTKQLQPLELKQIYHLDGINLVPVIQHIFKPQVLKQQLIRYDLLLVK